jgi:hypothetical protein
LGHLGSLLFFALPTSLNHLEIFLVISSLLLSSLLLLYPPPFVDTYLRCALLAPYYLSELNVF